MHRVCITLATLILWLVPICNGQVTSTTAAVPNLIRFSGILDDLQGIASVSSPTVGVTFAIYKEREGGEPVWQETHNVTPDSGGRYSVILGSTTAAGLPDDLFSQQEERWLSVQVQGAAEQARVLLVSVPYALKAKEAETLGGLPASAFVKAPTIDASASTSTEIGVAVNPVGAGGNAGSTLRGKRTGKLPPGCSPSPGFITYWDNTNTLCPTMLFWDDINQRLGIGITNPSEPLDVLGQISTYQWYDINEQRFASVHTMDPQGRLLTRARIYSSAGSLAETQTQARTMEVPTPSPASAPVLTTIPPAPSWATIPTTAVPPDIPTATATQTL